MTDAPTYTILSPTNISLAVTVMSGLAAVAGHNIDPGTQQHLVTAFTNIAGAIAILAPLVAGFFHKKAVNCVVEEKATEPLART